MNSPGYVAQWLNEKVKEISKVVEETCSLLEEDLQAKWTIMFYSAEVWLLTLPPVLFRGQASCYQAGHHVSVSN